jgi:hypothetical protein
MPNKNYLLGTAIKITTVLDVANPSSIKITIKDPGKTVKVDNTNMTQDSSTVYSYIYQSGSSDKEGEYVLTISAVYGSYTVVTQNTFEMELQLLI